MENPALMNFISTGKETSNKQIKPVNGMLYPWRRETHWRKEKNKEELGNAEIVISNTWSGKLWREGNNWAGALRGDA